MKLGPITTIRDIRHGHMFGGIGVGARGFNLAAPRVKHVQGRFVCVGSIDVDSGACRNFERMTGTKATCMDLFDRGQFTSFHGKEPPAGWREAGPEDIRAAYGVLRPDVIFLSAPCKGFSGLLSATQSKTDKYQALNGLTLRGVWLMLEAYKDDPIPIVLFENVPRILTRGKWLLDQIVALFRGYGYSVNLDTHDCGVIGGLAQSRKRALLIARHMQQIPPFIYQPKHHRLRGVGEVIGKLPLPGDPVAGAMHRVPALQWKTWVRLALVPAGKDWRALNELAVVDGNLRDFGIAPEAPLRDNALGVNGWGDTAPVITTHRAPGQGRFSVADPRPMDEWHNESLGVRGWDDTARVVAGASRPHNGAHSVADPRVPKAFSGSLGVMGMEDVSGTIAGDTHPSNGAFAVADPRGPIVNDAEGRARAHGKYPVDSWDAPGKAVIGGRDNGAYAVADPRIDGHPRSVQHGVLKWTETAGVVKGKMDPGQGPYAVSDPRLLGKPRFNNTFRIVPYAATSPAVAGPGGPAGGLAVADPRPEGKENYTTTKYKVTRYDQESRAVIGASTTGDGAFAVADPRGPHEADKLHGKYPVGDWSEPSRAVIAGRDNGAFAVADPRALGGAPREHYQTGGHYGVVDWDQTAYAVSGSACHDNGFNSVADPRDHTGDAAEIVTLPGPADRLVCRIIALDGTWHRPFTTLDLASLQSLFDPEEIFYVEDGRWRCRQPFDLDASSDVAKREWIGNAVPGAAATGMAETIGETILLAEQGETFTLSSREIWVKPGALALAVDNDQVAFRMEAGE